MEFVYISDLMIGDNSAVNYEFSLTKRPMVFVKSETKDVFRPPDQFNIKLCGPMYNPETDDIVNTIEEAFNNNMYAERIRKLVDNSFYYNDGHAVDRVCSFIVDKLSEKGILSRKKTLEKYRGKFIYQDNY
jgi:CDP-glycerol glycerophosphotransferase (TagB/SpsB family)